MKMKYRMRKTACSMLLFCLLFCGCSEPAEKTERAAEISGQEELYQITEADQKTEADEPVNINLKEHSAGIKIDQPGDYVLSGNFEGKLIIDSQDQIVHLIFDGVDIQSHEGPAVYVASAGKVVITLADKSVNIVRDSPNYDNYKDEKACIYSTSDVTINGSGSLQVYGYRKHALWSKDVVKVLGGDIQISAKGDGIRANDGAVIMPERLSVESEGNGIRTTKRKKDKKGYIDVCGGEINVIAGKNAFDAAVDIYIRNCDVSCQGIYAAISCGGNQFVEEGCLRNE